MQYIQPQYTVHTATIRGTHSHNPRYIQPQYTVHTVTIRGTYSHNKQETADEWQ